MKGFLHIYVRRKIPSLHFAIEAENVKQEEDIPFNLFEGNLLEEQWGEDLGFKKIIIKGADVFTNGIGSLFKILNEFSRLCFAFALSYLII